MVRCQMLFQDEQYISQAFDLAPLGVISMSSCTLYPCKSEIDVLVDLKSVSVTCIRLKVFQNLAKIR